MAESKTEQIKEQSRYLRGTIAETLRRGVTGSEVSD